MLAVGDHQVRHWYYEVIWDWKEGEMAHAIGSMLAQDGSMTRNIPAGTTMTGLLLDTQEAPK